MLGDLTIYRGNFLKKGPWPDSFQIQGGGGEQGGLGKKEGDGVDTPMHTSYAFSINSIIAHMVWTLLLFSRMCVNKIMESIASIIDQDMDYLVWTTLFLKKVKFWTL